MTIYNPVDTLITGMPKRDELQSNLTLTLIKIKSYLMNINTYK